MDILIKRGLQANVDKLVLKISELAFAYDTGNLYIGTEAGKVWVNPTGGTADEAVKLKTPRTFAITGDGTATAQPFDGTGNVNLSFVLNNISTLTAGTYTKLTVDQKGRVTGGANITIDDLPSIPSTKITGLKTKLSEFSNDKLFQTEAQVKTMISNLVAQAPETLDTLKELATALGNDPNFATTMATQLGTKEGLIKNSAEKLTLSDADNIAIVDGTDSVTKKTKFSAVKSTLKAYFDTLYNKYVHPKFTAKTSGLYKVTVDGEGHVTGATAVTKSDITSLGIPSQDTVYTLPTASATVKGGVKVDGVSLIVVNDVISVASIDGGTF